MINIADSVAVLRDGRLVEFGPRAEVLARLTPAQPPSASVTPIVRRGPVGVAP